MRIRPVLLAAALAALAAAPAARAQGYYPPQRYAPRETGLYLGGRIGFGFPNGDLYAVPAFSTGSLAVSDTFGVKVPFGLEFGARLNRVVRVGIFGDLAPVGVKDAQCGLNSCSGSDNRLGIEAQLHLAPFTGADPWFGIGLAYEWLNDTGVVVTLTNGTQAVVDEHFSGPQLVLQGGVDFPVTPQFTLGPYLGLEFGRFSDYSNSAEGGYSISEAGHGWVTIGIKGTFLL